MRTIKRCSKGIQQRLKAEVIEELKENTQNQLKEYQDNTNKKLKKTQRTK
jgi:hypothetical protein